MAKSNRIQVVGTEKPVSQNPPVGSPSSDPRSGKWQLMGTTVPMGRHSVLSPSANPKQGTYQIVGDETSLNRGPVKGWGNAAHLTMSDRVMTQTKNPVVGGKSKRR